MEKLYEKLEKAMDKKSRRRHFRMDDFSPKIGVNGTNNNMKCEGSFGISSRYERSDQQSKRLYNIFRQEDRKEP